MNEPINSVAVSDLNTVNGFIIAKGAAELIEFLTAVFDGTETPEAHTPDMYANDGTLIHAEVRIGNSVIMVADRKADWPFTPAMTQVYVTDAAETLRRAVERGARIITDVSAFYGGFDIARFLDPWGNLWWLFAPAADANADDQETVDWDDPEPSPIYTTLLDAMRQLTDPT
ncbi:VOC family protein [Stackebrandtia nassauensis]|uniref:Glyoxalase/bleomycin resistance protein/dioxygenase n=1 Tax=Stackebrandtia nassauensis (strain DSM 44728 / CIP 108903 / NRRL B-16338 / NBRC 102104 / LLR-40K-21) TaxID=446470 RepID=D3Q9Q7_STANL|nr:VOC family protein [Stackebrandtia nassauensis]ADD44603.1 Glyoxalase/bleomycin resistance protein/dioxygenase [Stackebrandtia nassauensis DSM 44728]